MTKLIIKYSCGQFDMREEVELLPGERHWYEGRHEDPCLFVGVFVAGETPVPKARLRFFNLARVEVVET